MPGLTNSTTIDPLPMGVAGAEDGPALDVVGEFVVGLPRAVADEGNGADGACPDGMVVAVGGAGPKKVHAESRQMMLVPPSRIAPILDFPGVPIGLV